MKGHENSQDQDVETAKVFVNKLASSEIYTELRDPKFLINGN